MSIVKETMSYFGICEKFFLYAIYVKYLNSLARFFFSKVNIYCSASRVESGLTLAQILL